MYYNEFLTWQRDYKMINFDEYIGIFSPYLCELVFSFLYSSGQYHETP